MIGTKFQLTNRFAQMSCEESQELGIEVIDEAEFLSRAEAHRG
jgi:hypothetical protein